MDLKKDFIACFGEFVGTTLFLSLAYGGAKTAQVSASAAETGGLQVALSNQTLLYIALSFGLSLLVTAWVFYRITGGLFNPAVTLALALVGPLTPFRAVLLLLAQILGGIAAAALIAALTSFGGISTVETRLGVGVNIAQGLFIEAFLTLVLVLTVLFLAVEKHKATYLAPIGIGLALLICHMFGVNWTGCGMNPARAFGPSVVSGNFPGYHWIYWLGPLIGTLISVAFYKALKMFDYESIVFAQDASAEEAERLEKGMKADEGESRSSSAETEKGQERARGKVIMVYKKRPKRNMEEKEKSVMIHHNQGGLAGTVETQAAPAMYNDIEKYHSRDSETVVDLDAVDFYECDSDVGEEGRE